MLWLLQWTAVIHRCTALHVAAAAVKNDTRRASHKGVIAVPRKQNVAHSGVAGLWNLNGRGQISHVQLPAVKHLLQHGQLARGMQALDEGSGTSSCKFNHEYQRQLRAQQKKMCQRELFTLLCVRNVLWQNANECTINDMQLTS